MHPVRRALLISIPAALVPQRVVRAQAAQDSQGEEAAKAFIDLAQTFGKNGQSPVQGLIAVLLLRAGFKGLLHAVVFTVVTVLLFKGIWLWLGLGLVLAIALPLFYMVREHKELRGDGDDAVLAEQIAHEAHAAHVLVAIFLREAEATAQIGANDVAVEDLHTQPVHAQVPRHALRHARLARTRQAGEPQGDALRGHRCSAGQRKAASVTSAGRTARASGNCWQLEAARGSAAR